MRYDVIRVAARRVSHRVRVPCVIASAASDWFPPFECCLAQCSGCYTQLGWRYELPSAATAALSVAIREEDGGGGDGKEDDRGGVGAGGDGRDDESKGDDRKGQAEAEETATTVATTLPIRATRMTAMGASVDDTAQEPFVALIVTKLRELSVEPHELDASAAALPTRKWNRRQASVASATAGSVGRLVRQGMLDQMATRPPRHPSAGRASGAHNGASPAGGGGTGADDDGDSDLNPMLLLQRLQLRNAN